MGRWSSPSSDDYYDEPWARSDPEPRQRICVYCDPPHVMCDGALPATHGMCPTAFATHMAQLDAEEAAKRGAA